MYCLWPRAANFGARKLEITKIGTRKLRACDKARIEYARSEKLQPSSSKLFWHNTTTYIWNGISSNVRRLLFAQPELSCNLPISRRDNNQFNNSISRRQIHYAIEPNEILGGTQVIQLCVYCIHKCMYVLRLELYSMNSWAVKRNFARIRTRQRLEHNKYMQTKIGRRERKQR